MEAVYAKKHTGPTSARPLRPTATPSVATTTAVSFHEGDKGYKKYKNAIKRYTGELKEELKKKKKKHKKTRRKRDRHKSGNTNSSNNSDSESKLDDRSRCLSINTSYNDSKINQNKELHFIVVTIKAVTNSTAFKSNSPNHATSVALASCLLNAKQNKKVVKGNGVAAVAAAIPVTRDGYELKRV